MGITAQIDTSIPGSVQGIKLPDIGSHIDNAISIANMLKDRKQKAVVFEQAQQDRAQRLADEQRAREQAIQAQDRARQAQSQDKAAGEMFSQGLDPQTGRFNNEAIPTFYKNFLPEVAEKYVKRAQEQNKYADEYEQNKVKNTKTALELAELRKQADLKTTDYFANELKSAANNPLAWQKTLDHMEESKVDFDPQIYNAGTPEERLAIAADWHNKTLTYQQGEAEEIAKAKAAHDKYLADEELKIKQKNAETGRINATKDTVPGAGKTPESGKPLSSDAAKTIGLISSGLQGASTLSDALRKGDPTFWATTMMGGFTNPKASIAFNKAVESLGRLNSGGAITDDEIKNFKRLVADKKALMTPEGREAIANELDNYINRGKATGNAIYGGESWQKNFGVPNSGTIATDNDPLGIR